MRVVGYVREAPGLEETETTFVQSERIRRWVAAHGHQLVAVCQDARKADETSREGYAALIRAVASDNIEAVVIPTLKALSVDKVGQEVVLWHLRSLGVRVMATEEADVAVLSQSPEDPSRLFIRDVLHKMDAHRDAFPIKREHEEPDVLIEIVAPNEIGQKRTARAS